MNTILVIEANTTAQAHILAALHKTGLSTLVATDAASGLDLAIQHLPDLIICAEEGPELDGYDLLAAIGQDPRTASLPVILVAEKLNKSCLHRAMRSGATGYLVKPLSETDLLETVDANLGRQAKVATRQQQLEDKVQHLEERFARFFHQAPIAIAVTRPSDGFFLDINRKFLEMFGYIAEELLNKNTVDVIWAETAERQKLLDVLAKEGSITNWEFKFSTKTGQIRYGVLSAEVIEYVDTQAREILTSFLDITERNQVEEALRQNQKWLAEAQQIGNIGSYIYNLATQQVSWSDQMFRINGLEPGEIDPNLENGRQYTHPDDWDLVYKTSAKAVATGQAECEVRVIPKQGEMRYVQIKLTLLRDNEGKPVSLLGTVQDITERRIIQESLLKSEKLFRSVAENSPDIIYILELPSYQPLYFNRSEFLGFTKAELEKMGATAFEVHPDEQPTIREQWRQLLDKKLNSIDFRFRNKKGEWIWLENRSSILSYHPDGSPAQILSLVSEINERKEAEARLRQQTIRAQLLAELSQLLAEVSQDYPKLLNTIARQISEIIGDGCGISLVSANREWLEVAAIYGPNPEIAEAYLQLVKANPLRVNEGTAGQVFKTGLPVLQPELTQAQVLAAVKPEHREDAQKFRIYSRVVVPLKAQGRIIGVLTLSRYRPDMPYTLEDQIFLQDLADRAALAISNARLYASLAKELIDRTHIQAERESLIEELEAKNAELERFTYTVSHDLKSPLITIRGFLGYLEKDATDGNLERLRKDIERISDATAKMQRLLNELLELSRIGRLTNPAEGLSLESVIQEALSLTQGQLNACGIQVEVVEGFPEVYGDRVRLVEVVQNLIDNAVKFMGNQSEPCIKIGWKSESGNKNKNVVFYVQDNGIGIEPPYHEKIFGLFDKLDPHSEGTGVGLALVKRIIEIHGGRIWVESAGAARGTIFYFTLPDKPVLVK